MKPPKQPLKIGFVLDDSLDKTDGVQQYVLGLGGWFSAHGHEVHYLVGESKRTDIQNVHSMARTLQARFNGNVMGTPLPASNKAIKELLDTVQFDVLHVQTPFSPFMAQRVIALAAPTTVIVGTFHILPNSRLEQLASRVLAAWTRKGLGQMDEVYSVSSSAQDFASTIFGVNSDVLPNVVDYDVYHDAKPYDKDMPTVLFLGRLVPRKGCKVLLEAVKMLQADPDLPEFAVEICGRGPLQQELETFVTENDLRHVHFRGFVTEAEKPKYYATADVAVFPSSGGESFGIVLLEAMASGKAAVLAGDNPGYRAVMQPRGDLLFNAKSPSILASKIRYVLTNPQERTKAAKWGEAYTRQFDTDVVCTELLNRYNKLLRRRRNMQ